MSISLTNETKNDITLVNADKGISKKWEDANWKHKNASGTWATAKVVLTPETKNDITLTKESK